MEAGRPTRNRDDTRLEGQASGERRQDRHAYETIAALTLLAGATALRFAGLSDKNIWLDEAASWSIVGQSWPEFWRVVVNDIHPPLYYLLLKGWVGVFGAAEGGLRGLSVVAGVATVWFGWRLARRWVAPSIALATMLWLAVSPHLIFYAQEARMYALATALVLGASLAYCRWIESEGRRTRDLMVFALSAAAALYVHYFTALWLAAVWVHFIAFRWFHSASCPGISRNWLIAHVGMAIAYAPWAPSAWTQLRHGQPWRADVAVADVPWYVSEMFRQCLLGYSGDLRWRGSSAALLVLAIALAGFGAFLISRLTRREPGRFILATCLVPVTLGLILIFTHGDMHLSRYLAYVVPFLIIAIARGWGGLLRSSLAAAAVAMGAMAMLPFTARYFADPSRDSDVRPILRYLKAYDTTAREGADRIVVLPGFMTFSYRFYDATSTLERIDTEAEWRAFEASAAAGRRPAWIILDYRWPEFASLSEDARFEVIAVPGGQPSKLRLLRTR